MAQDKRMREYPSASDQARLSIAYGAGALLDAGATEVFGPMRSGAYLWWGGGYDMFAGVIEADQTFSLTIAQGASFANQNTTHVLNSAVDPVSGLNVLLVRWPVGGEFFTLTITNTGGNAMTAHERSLYVLPHGAWLAGFYGDYPDTVQGADPVGAAPTHNPFIVAGVDAAGNTRRGQILAGATYDYLLVRQTDGTNQMPTMDAVARAGYVSVTDGVDTLGVAVDDGAVEAEGVHNMWEYAAVPAARGDGDAVRGQSDAYGHPRNAEYNDALGSANVAEIAPPQYDVASGTARAAAALPAAGAYDAAPVEIPTGNRKWLTLIVSYTRAVAGGSVVVRLETADTIGGVDYWPRELVINTGAFVPGADVMSQAQREDVEYTSTAAGAELGRFYFDVSRVDKFRVPCAELGAIANPGTVAIYYKLSN